MVTIKLYTDLQQSKKLAEILPPESADMEYLLEHWIDEKTGHHKKGYYEIPVVKVDDNSPLQQITHPCWSLAALLGALPKIVNHETLFIETSAALWHVGYRGICTARADNLVDACYEMILKLNELKML